MKCMLGDSDQAEGGWGRRRVCLPERYLWEGEEAGRAAQQAQLGAGGLGTEP